MAQQWFMNPADLYGSAAQDATEVTDRVRDGDDVSDAELAAAQVSATLAVAAAVWYLGGDGPGIGADVAAAFNKVGMEAQHRKGDAT